VHASILSLVFCRHDKMADGLSGLAKFKVQLTVMPMIRYYLAMWNPNVHFTLF